MSEQWLPSGSEDCEALLAENARLRSALDGWIKYFQSDVPMTADAMEEQGEDFTRCWFETQKALGYSIDNPEPPAHQ